MPGRGDARLGRAERRRDPDEGSRRPEGWRRVGNQKIVAATFRHDTSRNLDPQLHTHAVLANMVKGEDGKWRSMANEGLYARQKLLGMLYRNELAARLGKLGYGIEKTHADGRFEIAGVLARGRSTPSRPAAPKSRRRWRNASSAASADNPRLAERAALMTRAEETRHRPRRSCASVWQRNRPPDLGLDTRRRWSAEAVGQVRRAGAGSGAGTPETGQRLAAEPAARGSRRNRISPARGVRPDASGRERHCTSERASLSAMTG